VNNDGSNCFAQCCCEGGFITATAAGTGTGTGTRTGSGWMTGVTTRYWDCCKPSCTWPSNVNGLAAGKTTVRSCLLDGTNANNDAINVCAGGGNGGPSYSCVDNQPWTEGGVMYGYVAKDGNACCQCMELEFTSTALLGKRMVVQVTNTGGDLGSAHFDIQLPGGGFGIYNGCASNSGEPSNGSPQFTENYSVWGQRYGGLTAITDCDAFPAALQAGCRWRFTDFLNADNPSVNWRRVKCPDVLTAKTGCVMSDDDSYPLPGSSSTDTQSSTPQTSATQAGTGTQTSATHAATGTQTSATQTGTGTKTSATQTGTKTSATQTGTGSQSVEKTNYGVVTGISFSFLLMVLFA